jgi:hypothetical protein
MTQILPQRTNLGSQFGQAVGSGLSSGMQQGNQVAFQRGTLQKGLEGLSDIPVDTTPGQLVQKIISATAGIPGAERYVAPLYESLSQDLAARQKSSSEIGPSLTREFKPQDQNGIGEGSTQIQGTSLTKEGLQDLLGEKFFPNIPKASPIGSPESLKPQKPLVPPEPIGPAEEAKMRNNLRQVGITNPQVIDEQINKAKQYQNDLYKSQKEGFSNIEEYQGAKNKRDQDFFQEADLELGQAHGTMTPSEKSIWREMSRQFEDLPGQERFSNTEQMYNTLVGDPLIEFENSQEGLPIGSFFRPEEVKNRMDFARSTVQDHIKKINEREDLPADLKGKITNQLRDQYFNSMLSKDYGTAQAAYATSNLSDKAANSIPKAPPPKETAFETVYLGDPKERDKLTYSLANSLTNMQPEDSLILMREKALQNNYDDKAFNQALNLAVNSGKLKLSDRQRLERSKLSIPQRLSIGTILEGKRSVWDLFKGKQ